MSEQPSTLHHLETTQPDWRVVGFQLTGLDPANGDEVSRADFAARVGLTEDELASQPLPNPDDALPLFRHATIHAILRLLKLLRDASDPPIAMKAQELFWKIVEKHPQHFLPLITEKTEQDQAEPFTLPPMHADPGEVVKLAEQILRTQHGDQGASPSEAASQ